MRAILIVCAVMLSACAAHQPFPDHTSRFQTETNRVRIEFGFPGMTAAYVLSDGTVGTAASGLADVEASVPMTDNTRMLSTSIGKSFVGALCIALALEGRLTLDVNVPQISGKNFHDQASTLWLSHKNGPLRFVCLLAIPAGGTIPSVNGR